MGTHVYRLRDGSRVPSVTTVLGLYGDKEGLLYWANELGQEGRSHRDERQAAAGVGTIVHEMVEAHIKGVAPYEFSAEELHVPEERWLDMIRSAGVAFVAYLAWAQMTRVEVFATEVAMVSEEERYGGTPDAVAISPFGLALLDWKSSGSLRHSYIGQVAAYCRLWEHGHLLDDSEVTPLHFGEAIQTAHVIRFDKTHGTFTHAHLTKEVLRKGLAYFLSLRTAYDCDRGLKGAI